MTLQRFFRPSTFCDDLRVVKIFGKKFWKNCFWFLKVGHKTHEMASWINKIVHRIRMYKFFGTCLPILSKYYVLHPKSVISCSMLMHCKAVKSVLIQLFNLYRNASGTMDEPRISCRWNFYTSIWRLVLWGITLRNNYIWILSLSRTK